MVPKSYVEVPEGAFLDSEATNKRYSKGGKIHESAGPSTAIPKPGTSACLYPKPGSVVISELQCTGWKNEAPGEMAVKPSEVGCEADDDNDAIE